MDIKIRKAVTADLELLGEMLSELFSIEDDFEINPAKQKRALEMIISSEICGIILIAESDSKLTGMVSLQRVVSTAAGGYSVLLEDLYVLPEFRNSGTGKLLVDQAVQWGREHNAWRIQLAADYRNMAAADFYSGRGFKKSNMMLHYKSI